MNYLHRFAYLCLAMLAAGPLSAQELEFWSEARLRVERTELPNGREIDRFRLHAFAGVSGFSADESFEWGGALKLSAGDDDEADNRRNFDNESSDDFELGERYVRWFGDGWGMLEAGRTRSPFELTAMTWDNDFRPIGFSWRRDFEVRTFDRLALTAGYVAPRHIDESDSRLLGIQAGYHWREGAPVSFSSQLSLLRFDELGEVAREGRTRTNLRNPDGTLASDFTLLDLIIEARLTALGQPLSLTLDLVKNLDAVNDEDEGARFSARLGQADTARAWEVGYTYQRVQQEAVMGAFNEDDWWFPSDMRGSRVWVTYGLRDELGLRLSWFNERRDSVPNDLDRLFLDLLWNW